MVSAKGKTAKKYKKWQIMVPFMLYAVILFCFAVYLLVQIERSLGMNFLLQIGLFIVLGVMLNQFYEFYKNKTE